MVSLLKKHHSLNLKSISTLIQVGLESPTKTHVALIQVRIPHQPPGPDEEGVGTRLLTSKSAKKHVRGRKISPGAPQSVSTARSTTVYSLYCNKLPDRFQMFKP